MNQFHPNARTRGRIFRDFGVLVAISAATAIAPAWAGSTEASSAMTRAEAKIETVTRQAGQAGVDGDQSFNMARQRLANAQEAHKGGHHDRAERLADEASLLADLTGERATLKALQASRDSLLASSSRIAPAQ
jgi:hypothetical protein